MSESKTQPIVLYDGVCGLCNRLVQFLLKRDKHDYFRFATLQSPFADQVLSQHGANAADLDTVHVVLNYRQPTERLLARSDAILYLLTQLGGIWRLAVAARLVPKRLRDVMYRMVARSRYRVFGKYDSCVLPDEKYRHKFLDL